MLVVSYDETIVYVFVSVKDAFSGNFDLVLDFVEVELMKERFSKLLLGEDMSGCGNGVSTALAISNAITNLCGMLFWYIFMCSVSILFFTFYWNLILVLQYLVTVFVQLWRLEPLPSEKKSMWRREMEWLLCVGDHIVEFMPSWQTFPDGSKLEVCLTLPPI